MKTIFKTLFIGIIFLIFGLKVHAQNSWEEIISVEDLNKNHPELIQYIFQELDLNYSGLEEIRSEYESGNIIKACNLLLDYYRVNDNSKHLRKLQPSTSSRTMAYADTILNDVFTVQNVKGKVLYGADGHRDWYYKGPNNDPEWAWLSNRHHQIDTVLMTYFETGNPKYAKYIDLFLRDFILKSKPYPAESSWESIWRGLEVSFRSKSWPKVFYGLMNSEYLSDATKLLILSSLPEHADYNRNYHAGSNWLTMELSGLAEVATNFPEYKKSGEWLNYASMKLTESINNQVYPDGVQTELTSHYHYVALMNFEEFKTTCELANKPVPEKMIKTLEHMYDYLAKSMRPSGYGGLNNDSDLMYNRERIQKAANNFNRSDWEYIASNGTNGNEPKEVSYFYPWAGQLISRSDFKTNAHWSFFDIGPWGSSHQHSDKLHLSISAFGRDFLVDAGRFAYSGNVAKKFRAYATGSEGHNTLLIDNNGQSNGPLLAKEALTETAYKITSEYDFACGSFDSYKNVEGTARHNRSLLYVRGEFWIVVDRIDTDRTRKISTLWHWHPSCEVVLRHRSIRSSFSDNNLVVFPVGMQNYEIDYVKGQEKPMPQGWYSSEYNLFEPNPTYIYTSMIEETKNFVWIIQPIGKDEKLVKAEILSENEDLIKLRVKSEKFTYNFSIPFYDSQGIDFNKE